MLLSWITVFVHSCTHCPIFKFLGCTFSGFHTVWTWVSSNSPSSRELCLQEEAKKVEARVNKLTLPQLHNIMDILDIPRGSGAEHTKVCISCLSVFQSAILNCKYAGPKLAHFVFCTTVYRASTNQTCSQEAVWHRTLNSALARQLSRFHERT